MRVRLLEPAALRMPRVRGLATAAAVAGPVDRCDLGLLPARQLDVPIIAQDRNQCGATCLAMMMAYWNQVSQANPTRTKDQIADVINPFDSIHFERKAVELHLAGHRLEVACDGDVITVEVDQKPETTIHLDGQTMIGMGQYARSLGYATSLVNHATPEDLKRLLDCGIPAAISTSLNPGDSFFHDVVVSGYSADAGGQVTGWTLNNPWGMQEHISPEELQRRWQTTDPLDKTSMHQMLAVAPRSQAAQLPPHDLRNAELERASEGALSIASGIKHKDPLRVARGTRQLLEGLAGVARRVAGRILGARQPELAEQGYFSAVGATQRPL